MMRKIEPLYQTHKRLDQLTPEQDYREIVYLCICRLVPDSRFLRDLLINSTVLQSSVPPEDFPVLFRHGKSTYMTHNEKRMCDQNIIFSTFLSNESDEDYREAINKMNYMHARYPEYINQRSLFRAGVKFTAFLTVVERTLFGEHTQFKLLGKYAEKFEASVHLLWTEIFNDMHIKGMPDSYQGVLDFIYDKETGPIHHDFIPAGNEHVRQYYKVFEANFIQQNFSGWKRMFSPLGKRLLILSLPQTTRESVGETHMKAEPLFRGMARLLMRAVSLRAVYLPSTTPIGKTVKDYYAREYAHEDKCPIHFVGQGTGEGNKRYAKAKAQGIDMPWAACPYHSDNTGEVGFYEKEYPSQSQT